MLTLDALQPRLRQLKLSGMRDAISARAQEARARGLDPLEFLALLLDDEVVRREADSVARHIHQARFDEVCDLRDFDWSYNPEVPKARIWELASGRFIDEHAAVVLCGPTGVGKSFVAQALGVEACRQRRRVLFVKTSTFLADLAGGRADGSYQARMRRYVQPAVLILDDFALREYTVGQSEDLYEVVSRRYRRGSLMVTTNREPQGLYPLFPNPVLAEGLLDRLLNSAYIIAMVGRSYRSQQRPGERAGDGSHPPRAGPTPAVYEAGKAAEHGSSGAG
jgi:DNA replication protein DnaC